MLTYKEGNAIIANYLGYKYYSKGEDPYEYGWRLDKSKNYRRDYFLSRKPNLLIHLDKDLLIDVLINILLNYNIPFSVNNGKFYFELKDLKYSFHLNDIYYNLINLIQLINEQKRF